MALLLNELPADLTAAKIRSWTPSSDSLSLPTARFLLDGFSCPLETVTMRPTRVSRSSLHRWAPEVHQAYLRSAGSYAGRSNGCGGHLRQNEVLLSPDSAHCSRTGFSQALTTRDPERAVRTLSRAFCELKRLGCRNQNQRDRRVPHSSPVLARVEMFACHRL